MPEKEQWTPPKSSIGGPLALPVPSVIVPLSVSFLIPCFLAQPVVSALGDDTLTCAGPANEPSDVPPLTLLDV